MVLSGQKLATLQKIISEFNAGENAHFIVLDVKTDRQGWLPAKAWEFITNPKATWE
jgi:hypothetical protein